MSHLTWRSYGRAASRRTCSIGVLRRAAQLYVRLHSVDAVAPYLFFWNSWVVFPAVLVATGIAYWKLRKASLAVVAFGLILLLVAQGLRVAFPAPLHAVYVGSLIVDAAGFITAVGAFVWFMWKNYRGQKSAT